MTTDRPKVLVVNDDPGSLIGLVGLLSQWEEELGFQVMSARSGSEALREVLRHDFAVILLDVNMPEMNGFDTARAIHGRRLSGATPIIFVTAYMADELNRLKGYEYGAADYLFTPVIPEVLKSKLSVFVSLAQQKLKLKAQAHALDQRAQELAQANERLRAEIDRRVVAEQRTKTSEEFLAMLGHELRNPLAAVSNAATLLGVEGISPQQLERAVDIIQRQSGQLVRIVDDLLDLGRVMSGKISLVKRPVDVASVVESCLESLKVAGRTMHHVLNVRTESAQVEADPTRLEQIVTNLLDNALKYTPQGGQIDVWVRARSDEVEFAVRDSGIGMSADLLARIFNVFVQGDQPLDRPQGGLGIGLALVRQLVTLHGGTVTADSQSVGRGSIFIVRLPKIVSAVAAPAGEGELEVRATTKSGGRAGPSILLVEDGADAREALILLLNALGHQVIAAPGGAEGLRMAAEHLPSIGIIDIGLPGMSGYQVAQQLRADPANRDMALIALTGYGLEQDRLRALEAGFDFHLVKPVAIAQLSAVLARCATAGASRDKVS